MISIDQDKCNACGICSDICPRHIPETIESNNRNVTVVSKERINLCMGCGQCSAACPNNSIKVDGLNIDEFMPTEKLEIYEDQLLSLMTQRRSIRRYKDQPVSRDIIDRIIEAAHRAPSGTSRRTTGIIVIDNPQTLATFSKLIYSLYEKLASALENPIGRFFVKRSAGQKNFLTLRNFVMPGMHWYIRWYKEGKSDEIRRDCPALILFHSPIREPMCDTNCAIAAFHAIFMAEILGIGTCFNDLIPPACNRSSEIRKLLDLPEDREVYSSLTLGYPKYKYKRTIPRRLSGVRYL
jgi:nitroreductase/NAD-dependent dihydropyrimidine dehydrogenase PreA subunit